MADPKDKNPYDAGEILGLSEEEHRRRALRIKPWQTAWIGRVDTIPPQSDERTALIDRGLVLAGLLTEEQLAVIHRVGDQWLKHSEAVKLAGIAAARTADEALEAARREKAARKAERKKEAAEMAARRAEEVARRKREDIAYLGRGVSSGLWDRRSNIEALEMRGLAGAGDPRGRSAGVGSIGPQASLACVS